MVFDQFYQRDQQIGAGGYGLGLFLVKHIVQAHGGRIEVESQPGRGSRFTLVFPSAEDERAENGSLADTATRGVAKRTGVCRTLVTADEFAPSTGVMNAMSLPRDEVHRVLVVEDEPQVREGLRA